MTTHRFLFALALAAVVSIPTPAAARAPRGRLISGIVQKTNEPTREAEIVHTDTGAPLSFVWISRTIFVANVQVVDAGILEPGAKVEVIYHQPFFGRPFVTKVTLLSASDPHSNMSREPQMLNGAR
ncbi:MAG: hypothetical protein NTV51_10410 [Verrucomicrobia bacterium]|nr:hypothetical protein [Verrucomicrobiota bacterium]